MNYNNFSCRLIAPRVPAVVRSAEPRKVESKKERKPSVRRRLASAASAAAIMLFGFAMSPAASAKSIALDHPTTLRLVPAAETVAFTGATGHLSLDLPVEASVAESDLTSQLESLSAQVRALTSKPFPSVHPAQAMKLSALTGVLLCAGLGVAIVRAGLLFRTDFVC